MRDPDSTQSGDGLVSTTPKGATVASYPSVTKGNYRPKTYGNSTNIKVVHP